eukprot:scaffold5475_cov188-Prasinococcus_capsulatus_cf.AAC.1
MPHRRQSRGTLCSWGGARGKWVRGSRGRLSSATGPQLESLLPVPVRYVAGYKDMGGVNPG